MNVPVRYQTVFPLYPYQRTPDQDAETPARHPVVIVGGGPVGICLALDLGRRGTQVLLLDDHEGAGIGSKAICFSKRSLDIAHRLGVKGLMDKGIVWNVGRVFHADDQVFDFNLLPEMGHRHPAFINLQQPYFEKYLAEAVSAAQAQGALIEMRGRNLVTDIEDCGNHVALSIQTPDGLYSLKADYVVACDGARSPVREMMGLEFQGRVFEDNFLIADVKMTADFPTERWFWFEPPFKGAGQSALLHKQPDDVWRIDFQLGWEIDRAAELTPERVRPRVDAMLASRSGTVPDYDLVWTSIYTFQCRRMDKFRHGRILFAGDSAHQVSPFGARGANSGLQDAENLAWKLDLVMRGDAPDVLLDSYCSERGYGADENILNSSRATDFMTPKSEISKIFRDAVLNLASRHSFARPLVNSGRLSLPCVYDGHPLFGPDALEGPRGTRPGSACPDAPLGSGYLLDHLGGAFTVMMLGGAERQTEDFDRVHVATLHIPTPSPELRDRYMGTADQAVYLIRPDQHVVARWPVFDAASIRHAVANAIGRGDKT